MAYEKKKTKSQPIKVLLLLAVLLPLALSIIASTLGRREFSLPHRLALELLGTAQSTVTHSTGFFRDIWKHYVSLVGVSKENEKLHIEIKQYKALNVQYREAVATNVRLNKILDLEQSFASAVLTAQIIGRDPSLWFKTITISRGSSSGIEKGMPVVAPEGVVGQVTNVSPHYAKILLATDPNSAIDAIVQKNRVQGIIKGDGRNYLLHYVLKNSEVRKGDPIITSGMGGVFPKGLSVGVVEEVVKGKRGMFQKIKVEPAVDLRTLEYVTVILQAASFAD